MPLTMPEDLRWGSALQRAMPKKGPSGRSAIKAKRGRKRPKVRSGPSPGSTGSFHYLNAQKRAVRDYARTHLDLGRNWRQVRHNAPTPFSSLVLQ